MATTGVTSDAVGAWIEANWHLDITLADWWQRLADAGYAFPHWPTGFGGSDMRAADVSAIQQLLGTHGVIGPPTGNAPNMGVPTVLTHGTDDQQARFVRPVANGAEAWCQLFSEPGAGSDLASLATKAERDGDEYVDHRSEGVELRAPTSASGGCCSPAPTPTCPSTPASRG